MIKLSKSCLSNKEIKRVNNVLKKEFLGSGNETKIFEKKLENYFKSHVVCCVNGTAAIQLALQACGAKKGDEVLCQSITFAATYQAITATGAKVIPCDIKENLAIDLEDAKKKLSKKTKFIVPVYYGGIPSDIQKIYNFAKKYNLIVVEDAAHSFGTTFKNKLIGSHNKVTCFSFDGIKNITSGEGGCIVTKSKNIKDKINIIKNLGIENKTKFNLKNFEIDVKHQGWRYHMSDLMAAIGIAQFERKKLFFQKRVSLSNKYISLLKKCKKISFFVKKYKNEVPHIFPIRIRNLKNKNLLRENLQNNQIQIGGQYYPLNFTYFFDKNRKYKCKRSMKIYNEIITLPLHYDITEKDVNLISNVLISELKKDIYFKN